MKSVELSTRRYPAEVHANDGLERNPVAFFWSPVDTLGWHHLKFQLNYVRDSAHTHDSLLAEVLSALQGMEYSSTLHK